MNELQNNKPKANYKILNLKQLLDSVVWRVFIQ